MFIFLLFLHFHSSFCFLPVTLFHLLYYLFYLSSPFPWETTQNDSQGLTYRQTPTQSIIFSLQFYKMWRFRIVCTRVKFNMRHSYTHVTVTYTYKCSHMYHICYVFVCLTLTVPWISLVYPYFKREATFGTSCMLSCTRSRFWKEVYSKRKEFAPRFFLFRVDSFPEGSKIMLKELPPLESVSVPLKCNSELNIWRLIDSKRSLFILVKNIFLDLVDVYTITNFGLAEYKKNDIP